MHLQVKECGTIDQPWTFPIKGVDVQAAIAGGWLPYYVHHVLWQMGWTPGSVRWNLLDRDGFIVLSGE